MKVFVNHLGESARKAEGLARFGEPLNQSDVVYIAGNGLQDAAHRAAHCLGWIWRQWLLGTSRKSIAKQVEPFVARGLEFRERSRSYHKLPHHDCYLLHCAIFALADDRVREVTARIADAAGDKNTSPLDDGELYAAAWGGMLKYWILGDFPRAAEQADLIWSARRESGVLAAGKSLVGPWLKQDWQKFLAAQEKDFERLWQRARKDRWTVKSESASEIVVTTEKYQIEHMWCWAHCGLALLANRQGIEVRTDPYWFPPAARITKPPPPASESPTAPGPKQQSLF